MPEEAPDGCPVHHLPREQSVIIRWGTSYVRYSAGLVCDEWHDAAPLRQVIDAQFASLVAESAYPVVTDLPAEPPC